MIRFEVTGATPEEFAENAMKAWGLLAIGLQQALRVQPQEDSGAHGSTLPTHGLKSSSTSSKVYVVPEEVVDFAMELDRRGGLIREKIEEREKVHADPVDDLFVLENPSFETKATGPTPMDGSSRQTKSSKSAKGPKLDDLKTRLSEVIVAATERWDQKRANAYARKLLNEWRAPKLSDLAADQYEIFMQVSAAYLDGTAAE